MSEGNKNVEDTWSDLEILYHLELRWQVAYNVSDDSHTLSVYGHKTTFVHLARFLNVFLGDIREYR